MAAIIPLSGGAAKSHHTFSAQLGDNLLDFRLNYIARSPGWSMDIYSGDSLIIAGAMLVPGAEITKGYGAGIGSLVFVGAEPTIDNLGKDNKLVWIDG